MDFSAPHMEFVAWSYAITTVVLGCLTWWILARGRSIARRLKQLDAEGAARRRKIEGTAE